MLLIFDRRVVLFHFLPKVIGAFWCTLLLVGCANKQTKGNQAYLFDESRMDNTLVLDRSSDRMMEGSPIINQQLKDFKHSIERSIEEGELQPGFTNVIKDIPLDSKQLHDHLLFAFATVEKVNKLTHVRGVEEKRKVHASATAIIEALLVKFSRSAPLPGEVESLKKELQLFITQHFSQLGFKDDPEFLFSLASALRSMKNYDAKDSQHDEKLESLSNQLEKYAKDIKRDQKMRNSFWFKLKEKLHLAALPLLITHIIIALMTI